MLYLAASRVIVVTLANASSQVKRLSCVSLEQLQAVSLDDTLV